MRKLNHDVTEEEVSQLIKDSDLDSDGMINLEEFVNMVNRSGFNIGFKFARAKNQMRSSFQVSTSLCETYKYNQMKSNNDKRYGSYYSVLEVEGLSRLEPGQS